MGAGHSHGTHRAKQDDLDEVQVARGPRAALLGFIALATAVTLAGMVTLWPSAAEVHHVLDEVNFAAPGVTFPTAEVMTVQPACPRAKDGSATGAGTSCGNLAVRVTDGAHRGDRATVQVAPQVSNSHLAPGDRVRLQRAPSTDGSPATYSYFGTERSTPLLVLLLVLVVLVLLVARLRGLFALIGLVISGLVVWRFMLPALLVGENGLLIGLCGSAAIMLVVLYLTHGASMRTSAALAGTLVGLAVVGVLGVTGATAARLTGISDETAGILSTFAGALNFHGLMACATVVAGLGVLNDVTITQSSAVWEIRGADPEMSRTGLFNSAMRIGRDHIASTIYTVVFAYTGAALAVLLVVQLYGLPWAELLTTEEIGEELVRTMAGTIGLVLAVPLTTLVAALVVPGPRPVRDAVPEYNRV
jgi:uncharacterized membrane protein